MPASDIRIAPYLSATAIDRLDDQLDAIFFGASATSSFASEAAKTAFRQRWLGRYLNDHPGDAFLALAGDTIAGYLIGSPVDPALDPANADLDYVQRFAALSRTYPAHLHINLAPAFRSAGIGGQMIEAYGAHVAAGIASGRVGRGYHAVTAKGMRNVGFYERHGFRSLGETSWRDRTLVFLARDC